MQRKKQTVLFGIVTLLLLLSLNCNLLSMADNSKKFEDGLVQNYHPATSQVSQYMLSAAQQAQVDEYGYPDRFTIFFFDEMLPDGQLYAMRHESWYYDARGYEIVFRNGDKFTERKGEPIQIEGLGRTVYAPQGFTAEMNLDALLALRGEKGFFVQNVDDSLITGELIFIKGLAAGFEEGRLSYVETLPLSKASPSVETPPLVETPPQVEIIPNDILLQDDFSDTNSGWDRNNWDDGYTDYDNGFYRILVKTPLMDIWANPGKYFEGDVRIDVDTTKIGGEDDNNFGLICRYNNSSDGLNYYFFIISSDGFAMIGKVKNGATEYISSEKMEQSDMIRQGATPNHLRADCIGDSLTLYVNGEEVANATDTSFTDGDIGITAGTFDIPRTEIIFDNLVVRKP